MTYLILDIETRSTADLKKVGTYAYAASPDTTLLCAAYAVDEEEVQLWRPGDPCPPEIKQAVKDNWTIIAHNSAFERVVWKHILGPRHKWPEPKLENWRCTMAMSYAQALPGALDNVAKVLRLSHQKDVVGGRVMLQLAKPRKALKNEIVKDNEVLWIDDAEKLAILEEYCKNDVAAERELFWVLHMLSDIEQRIWIMDQQINDRGLHIDRKLATAAQKIAETADVVIDEEIAKVTDGVVTSIGQVKVLTEWLGVVNLNKKTITDVLADPEKYLNEENTQFKWTPEVKRALELRAMAAQAAVKKVKSILTRCSVDDRVRGAFMYHAAGTGRWSSRGVQLQNLKRSSFKEEDLDKAIKVISGGDFKKAQKEYANPLAVIGDLIRAMVCAVPGHTLIGADFSGIEARVTAWLAGERSKLEVFARYDAGTGPDPYVVAATKIYEKSADKISKEERQIGKAAELALGYQGGLGALRKFMPEGKFTDEELLNIRNIWRKAHPNISALWVNLERACWKAMNHPGEVWACGEHITFMYDDEAPYLWMTLPSGRRIGYPQARKIKMVNHGGAWIESEWGDLAMYFKDSASGAWRDVRIYGGYLTENAVQAISRDLLAESMLRIDAAGFKIVGHVHDETILEVPDNEAEIVIKKFGELMTVVPDWGKGIPVVAKAWKDKRYVK